MGAHMFDTSRAGLLRLIQSGESELVEFKMSLPPETALARQMIAFANAKGGILIIGVDENGHTVGLSDSEAEAAAARLRRVASLVCEWSTHVGVAEVDSRKLVFMEIEPAPAHLVPTMTSAGEVYERRGTQNVRLTNTQSLRLIEKRSPEDHSPIPPHHPERPCKVFVAMSFREEQEPALVDYYNAMKRAVERTGLPIEIKRVDLIEGDYEISQKLMDEIEAADIILADFTLNSANVYFELGYARGSKKRVVQTARKDVALEFDVRSWRTIIYRNATELEERLMLELKAAHDEVMKPNADRGVGEAA